jgi:hypothetical protein
MAELDLEDKEKLTINHGAVADIRLCVVIIDQNVPCFVRISPSKAPQPAVHP